MPYCSLEPSVARLKLLTKDLQQVYDAESAQETKAPKMRENARK